MLGATNAAQAEDFFDFLNHAFGGGAPPRGETLPQPSSSQPEGPPLTVRTNRRHHRLSGGGGPAAVTGSGRRYDVADLKGITIYTDRTLSRGDAVMTATGLKVFNGSSSWPHTDDDFEALSSGKVPALVRKELTAIDNASRPELRR